MGIAEDMTTGFEEEAEGTEWEDVEKSDMEGSWETDEVEALLVSITIGEEPDEGWLETCDGFAEVDVEPESSWAFSLGSLDSLGEGIRVSFATGSDTLASGVSLSLSVSAVVSGSLTGSFDIDVVS